MAYSPVLNSEAAQGGLWFLWVFVVVIFGGASFLVLPVFRRKLHKFKGLVCFSLGTIAALAICGGLVALTWGLTYQGLQRPRNDGYTAYSCNVVQMQNVSWLDDNGGTQFAIWFDVDIVCCGIDTVSGPIRTWAIPYRDFKSTSEDFVTSNPSAYSSRYYPGRELDCFMSDDENTEEWPLLFELRDFDASAVVAFVFAFLFVGIISILWIIIAFVVVGCCLSQFSDRCCCQSHGAAVSTASEREVSPSTTRELTERDPGDSGGGGGRDTVVVACANTSSSSPDSPTADGAYCGGSTSNTNTTTNNFHQNNAEERLADNALQPQSPPPPFGVQIAHPIDPNYASMHLTSVNDLTQFVGLQPPGLCRRAGRRS